MMNTVQTNNVQFGALMLREKSIRNYVSPKEVVGQFRIARRKEADAIRLLEDAGLDVQISGVEGARVKNGKLVPARKNNALVVEYINRDTRQVVRHDVYGKDRSPREVILMALGTGLNLFILKAAQLTKGPIAVDFEDGQGPKHQRVDSRGRRRWVCAGTESCAAE